MKNKQRRVFGDQSHMVSFNDEELNRKIPPILKLTAGGMPVAWVPWKDAVVSAWNGKVLWGMGEKIILHGGTRAGEQSTFELDSIIACNEKVDSRLVSTPALTNRELFFRDRYICLYCGDSFSPSQLTNDHVIPVSKGGLNKWGNCVTACRNCNHRKADRTPEEAGMPLLAVPYAPSRAEFLILQNRRIMSDQMDFLLQMVPQESRFRQSLDS